MKKNCFALNATTFSRREFIKQATLFWDVNNFTKYGYKKKHLPAHMSRDFLNEYLKRFSKNVIFADMDLWCFEELARKHGKGMNFCPCEIAPIIYKIEQKRATRAEFS